MSAENVSGTGTYSPKAAYAPERQAMNPEIKAPVLDPRPDIAKPQPLDSGGTNFRGKPASHKPRKSHKKAIIVLVLLLAAIGAATYSIRRRLNQPPVYVTKAAITGDLRQTVDATGTIDAVTTVQVGSQISGTIAKIDVDFNSHVSKGQLVAEIDPRIYQGQVLQAQADLDNAKATLATNRANLLDAQARATQSSTDYQRNLNLGKAGVVSQQQVDVARATADSNAAQVTASESQIKQAQASVSLKEAALAVAQTNLAYTKIYAPIDGTVINRAVDVGQTVAAAFQTPTLFTIAQDLTKMQLHVSTDEGDVGGIRVGQPVTFRVDAFPGETFTGAVSQVRMNATTVQNVVTYDTIAEFANPQLKLFPGMTAYVSIPVASASAVLTVPNSAIRFRIDETREKVPALLAKAGIDLSESAGGDAASAARKQWGSAVNTALIWKLMPDRTIQPVLIRKGITDHASTAVDSVLKGSLSPGDAVIIGEEQSRPGQAGQGNR